MSDEGQRARRLPAGLIALAVAKSVVATAQRWVSVFLPVLTTAFGISTATMTSIMGFGQLGGLITSVTGRRITEHNERSFMLGGLGVVALSSAIALVGTPWAFAVSFLVLVIGNTHMTVAAHAWIGHRVPYAVRGRAIGLFETSWAAGLLIGAPILAALLTVFSWRAGYIALLIATTGSLTLVARRIANDAIDRPDAERPAVGKLGRSVWPPILASAFAALAGIGFFAVAGAWLSDVHGVNAAGLGLIAGGYGLMELIASTSVATITDRIGAKRAVLFGLGIVLVAIIVVWNSAASLPLAVVGLLAYLGGFEYAFVSSLALVTEAAPTARGAAIGLSTAMGTIGRSVGVAASGLLYEAAGIHGPLLLATGGVVASAGWVFATRLGADTAAA